MTGRSTTFTTFHIALLGALAGCSSAPQPLALAPLTPTVAYQRVPRARAEGAAIGLEVRWFAVKDEPSGEAVSRASAAIVRDRGAPFRGRSRMPIGSRWLDGDDLATWRSREGHGDPLREQQLATAETAIVAGLSTQLPPASDELPELQVHLAKEDADVVNAMLNVPADERMGREVIVIERALTRETPGALFVPTEALRPGGLLVVLTPTGPAPDERIADAISIADAETAPEAPVISPRRKAWQVAREAVGARNRRPALLALVTPLQLARVIDVLVVADERALIAATGPMTAADADADDVGWQLERGLWQSLMPRLEREELTAAMRASCARNLGAVAFDPASLSLLLETSADGEQFFRGVVEENVISLDDRSAAVRIIAEAYLALHGTRLEGYDAMAERSARRVAIRRYFQSQEDAR